VIPREVDSKIISITKKKKKKKKKKKLIKVMKQAMV
jgi:hypothetical protein